MDQERRTILILGVFSLLFIIGVVQGAEPVSRATSSGTQEEIAGPARPGEEPSCLITITPSASRIVFDGPVSISDFDNTPGGALGSLSLTVQSFLPEWGVYAQSLPLVGPAGVLPAERVRVRTDVTGNQLIPMSQAVPVVVGDLRLPVTESTMDLAIQPQWEDSPGQYEGEIQLMPYVPAPGEEGFEPGGGGGYFFVDETQNIGVQLEIPETMTLSVSAVPIEFTAGIGPGTYEADNEVLFEVSTNARAWRIECQAEPLRSEKGEIPAERVLWERVDSASRRIAEGRFGDQQTVVSGLGAVRSLQVAMRFKVEVTLDDVAGHYQGTVHFVGTTD